MIQDENDIIVFDDNEGKSQMETLEIPPIERKIVTQAYDKSVSDVVRMVEDGEIRLDPDYQRNYVWDNKKASLLVESIILNVPIPIIYVSQEKDETWTVIDGLQRLYSLKRFFNGAFKLTGMEVLKELNKCDINNLSPKAARMLKNGLLRIIMISCDSNEDIKYDVFMRLNTGSVHLTEQELRNCLYRGSFNDTLKQLSKNDQWLRLIGLSKPHKRMADRELILRFFALYKNWDAELEKVMNYRGRMKTFLNEFMRQNQNITPMQRYEYEDIFNESVRKVSFIFGENAFKRLRPDGTRENPINRALMDVLLISVTQFKYEELQSKHTQILMNWEELSKDQAFQNSVQNGTSDTKVLEYRLSRWCSVLKSLMNNEL